MDHNFGATPPFTVGIEEEILLVDDRTHMLADVAEELLEQIDLVGDSVGYEAYAAELEFRSPPCERIEDAAAAIRRVRLAALGAGATLMGAGLHPAGAFGDARLVAQERYERVGDVMRGLIRRTPECALHVHVGVPDPDTAIRAYNGLRAHLPLLQGLAANSPWWFGVDSGMASARFAFVRSYPSRIVPRAFANYDDYAAAVQAAVAAGALEDYTYIWWDVRVHPRLGTIEVREMDAQAPIDLVAALAALVQALARFEAERREPVDSPPEAIAQASFNASRDGLDARILSDGELLPLREAAERALERVRPFARELGGDGALEGIERILRDGNGADRQRAAQANGGMAEALRSLVRDTDPRSAALD
jgi:carboxylate-amine ligase